MTARLTVLAGPSGVGKTSVAAEVCRRDPRIWLSVSLTTRAPRAGERDGVDYTFVSPEQFADLVATGELLEHDAHFSASYGTPRAPVLAQLAADRPVLLEIDVNGARQVRAAMPAGLFVFLAPPSQQELERRLLGRGSEDPERVLSRLTRARLELAARDEFDQVLVNEDISRTADRLLALMAARDPGPSAPAS